MTNTTEKSTILLLCLGLDSDKTEIKKVGIAELKEIFGGYGHLKKVIIFTRKLLLKAFLEYECFETAEVAKNSVHEKFIKNYGKARLYYSPMQNLKFSNKYLEYWADNQHEKPLPNEDDVSTKQSMKFSFSEISTPMSFRKDSGQSCSQSSNMPHGRYTLFSSSNEFLDSNFNRDSFLSTKNLIFNSQQTLFNAPLDVSKPSIFNQLDNTAELSKVEENSFMTSVSKVVLVSNLGHVFRNTEELFNLFSSFGNIAKILFMKNLQKTLVEYTEITYASESITNLNNLVLGETKLRVNYSKYRSIDLNKNNKNENSMHYNEVLIVPPMRNRYKSSSRSSVIPISSKLLVSFPKISGIQTIDIYLAIERICKPVKTKMVNNKNIIGKNEVISMLFSFENIESAVYVMYKCHNSIVKGALLDIFFF